MPLGTRIERRDDVGGTSLQMLLKRLYVLDHSGHGGRGTTLSTLPKEEGQKKKKEVTTHKNFVQKTQESGNTDSTSGHLTAMSR